MYPTGRVTVPRLCVFFMIAQTFVEQGTPFLSDKSINMINSSAQNSWKAGRNYDLNSEEKVMRLLDKLDAKNLDKADTLPVKTKDPAWPSDEKIPKKFDARKKWGKICPQISEIQDQGHCGSSWAVASSSAASDRLCIRSKGKFQDSLSAQHVAFCSMRFGNGCDGGNSFYGWNFLKKSGVVTGGGFNSSKGVYKNTTSEYLGNLAVRALGWGEENGKPYWLIANAWNSYWGDKGLFKIKEQLNLGKRLQI